jgi:hypothetical protein
VADDADRLAFVDLQIDAVKHRHAAITGAQVSDLQHHVGALKWVGVGVM